MIRPSVTSVMRKTAGWLYNGSRYARVQHRGKVIVLAYHRVLPEHAIRASYIQPGMYVLTQTFEAHLQFLQQEFRIISLPELLERWQQNTMDRHERYCVITFDDGWHDTYQYAYPMLRRYRIPATIFLPTSLIGTRHWFWPEKLSYLVDSYEQCLPTVDQRDASQDLVSRYPWAAELFASPAHGKAGRSREQRIETAIEQWKVLSEAVIEERLQHVSQALCLTFPEERALVNWEEVRQMSQHRITFGSHSCTHPILPGLSLAAAKHEIEASNRMLCDYRVSSVPVFCYPNGSYNPEIQTLVRDSGYHAAVTTRFGFETGAPQDWFGIKRILIHQDISATIPLFSLHLSGLTQTLKAALRRGNGVG